MTDKPSRGMEFFDSLRGFIEEALASNPALDKTAVAAITSVIEHKVVEYWGGLQIYVPRETLKLLLRNEHIYADYDGTNLTQLSRKYQLTEHMLRNIIRDIREARRLTPKPGERLKPAPPPAAEQQQLMFGQESP